MVTSYIAVCAFIQDACLRRQWQLLYKVSSPSVAMEEGQIAASIFINEQGTSRKGKQSHAGRGMKLFIELCRLLYVPFQDAVE